METATHTTLAAPLGSGGQGDNGRAPVQSAPGTHPVTKGCKCSACEAKRKEWRDKGAAQRARKRGESVQPSLAPLGTEPPAPLPAPSPVPPAPVSSPVVAWDSSALRPLFEAVIPECEKWDCASLKADAAKVSPAAVRLVEDKASWNPIARTTLIETGPAVTADALNAAGIDAKRAPLVAFLTAACSIFFGRQMLKTELEALAEEQKKAKEEK